MLTPHGNVGFGWARGTALRIVVAFVLAGALAACDDFDGWDYSVFDVAQTAAADVSCPACDCQTAGTGTCRDCIASLAGKAMRFRSLTVTEPLVPTAPNPAALPEFLNGIWQEDVRRYILNIMLRIDTVDTETGTLTLVGGAGWHDLGMDDLPTEPGGDLTQIPSVYTILAGASAPFTVQLDEECSFTLTSAAPTVGFHPGPADHPNICTSEGTPLIPTANSIPIVDLNPSGTINSTCTGVVSGKLRGCIASEAAARICSWGPAPDYTEWYYTPNQDWPDTPSTPDFCKRWCGVTPGSSTTKWTNFGGFVTIIRVPLECDSDGDGTNDGYAIAGDFEAEIVDLAE